MEIHVAMIGAGAVGKTEILRRLSGESFRPTYHPTDGSELWTLDLEGTRFIVKEYSGRSRLRDVPQEELDSITAYIIVTTELPLDKRVGRELQKKMPNNIPYCVVVNKIDVVQSNHDLKCCAKQNITLSAPFLRIADYFLNLNLNHDTD